MLIEHPINLRTSREPNRPEFRFMSSFYLLCGWRAAGPQIWVFTRLYFLLPLHKENSSGTRELPVANCKETFSSVPKCALMYWNSLTERREGTHAMQKKSASMMAGHA